VAVATGKLDGLLFLLGALFGIGVFAETLVYFETFWLSNGFLGRLTLPELLGLPWGVVALMVVVMALLVFRGVEALERKFGGSPAEVTDAPAESAEGGA
jgi:hypothetical protein